MRQELYPSDTLRENVTAAALPPPPTTRKARSTYHGLIDATREVSRRTGSPSPEAVAEQAGVSPATFYAYFSSKDAALAAAFDSALDEMHSDLTGSLAIEPLLEAGLETVVETATHSVVRGFARDARLFRLAISRLPESPLIRAVYREHEERILEHLARFIRLGIAAGKIRAGEPGIMSQALLITIQGYQNPLLHRTGVSPLVDELASMMLSLLRP